MSDASSQSPVFPDDVDVAIVSHNGRATLPRLLQCLAAAGAPPERIVVHDVGSTDDTSAWLARDWPRVTVRRIDGNVGPNPARNRALLEATRPYVLLLDADAYVRPDAAARLRSALDPAKSVGTTVPVVVHSHDPNLIQYTAGSIHFMCEAINPWQNRPLAERGTKLSDIGTAPGVAYLIDVSVAQRIGLFDERYFLGKEDGDFCHRLVMAGYRLVEDPLAIVEHPSKPRLAWLFKWQLRNRWHFLLKNYEVRTLIILLPALAFHEVLQFGMLVLKGHVRAWWTRSETSRPGCRRCAPNGEPFR